MTQNIVYDIIVILWKKTEQEYRCYMSNNNLEMNMSLEKYIKDYDITFADMFRKLIEKKEHQFTTIGDTKIILEYMNDDKILELHVPIDENLYLLSSISHKIRNPLTNILGVLTLIDEEKMDKTQKKYINILRKSSYDIVGVANDIVDIINLSRDEIKLTYEKTNMEKTLHECHEIIWNDASKKNINVILAIDKNVPKIIIVDVKRLKQIIINLLNNALYHTNIGSVTVEVSLYNKNDNAQMPFIHTEAKTPMYNILFKIKDTGVGLDEDSKKFVEKILGINKNQCIKPYKYGGFGLLISRHLCYLMGGNIWYKSEKDIGTIFYFNIICEGISINFQ